MSGFALGQIIIRANEEIRMAIAKLEVEESGRDVARLQGNLSGYKKLISAMCAEFHLSQIEVEDNGESSVLLADLDDAELDVAQHDAIELQNSEEWKAVIARIDAIIEGSKNYLLYSAEKSRDLDLKQGEYKGMMICNDFFSAIENEVKRRRAIAEQKAREPDLPFEDEEMTPDTLADLAAGDGDDDEAESSADSDIINVDFTTHEVVEK